MGTSRRKTKSRMKSCSPIAKKSTSKRTDRTRRSTRARQPKLYEVEAIVYAEVFEGRRKSDRHWCYRVKWLNFADSDNSWEPQSSFKDDIVKLFWADVQRCSDEAIDLVHGVADATVYDVSKRFAPSSAWITRQSKEAAEASKRSNTVRRPSSLRG